ncbi:MAG TPA: hypothetical protein VKQ30_18600 [Ktedonobacterales bacterium]|nr:hypothetical protein [Ktedonobacterales bacterium]
MSTPEYPGGYSPQQGNSFQTQSNQSSGYAAPAPATQPTRKRRHPVRTTLLILLVLVLLAGGGAYAYAQSVRGAIASAAQSFCTDLKAQNYTGAYALLSSGYQAKVTQQQFTQAGQLHDQIDGTVQSCAASDSAGGLDAILQLGSTSVTFPAHMTRNKTFSGDMSLVNQGGSWKVDAVDQSLQGTSLGPILVANDYCAALAAGNIQQAYGDLSPDYQSRLGSEQQYAQTLQGVLTQGVSLSGCTPDLKTYSVTGTTAKLNGTLDVHESGITVNVPIALTFAESGGGVWKIDSATLQPQA